MANGTAREDSHIGSTSPNIHNGYAQFALIIGQNGLGRCQRVEQQLLHFQAAAAHALDDVLGSTLRTGHDMNLGFQTNAAHADRLAHLMTVDDEFLRLHQQQALVGRDIDGLGGLHHTGHVGRRDLLVLDGHHTAGIQTTDVAASNAGANTLNLAVSHQLGFFECLLNALHGGVDIDDHTTLQAVAGGHTQARQLELAIGHHLSDHRHDFGCADIQPNNHILVFSCHISLRPR